MDDLAAAKAFYLALGLEVDGEGDVAGAWVDRVIGLDGVKNSVVFLRVPGGAGGNELINFSTPVDERGIQPSFANTLGIRHIAFAVEDIEAVVAKLQARETQLVGEIQHYEDRYMLCYVRGPEGIIIELTEQIK